MNDFIHSYALMMAGMIFIVVPVLYISRKEFDQKRTMRKMLLACLLSLFGLTLVIIACVQAIIQAIHIK